MLSSAVTTVLKDYANRRVYSSPTDARASSDHGLTLHLLEGRHIAFEGVPAVGKTTAMHSVAQTLRQQGARVVTHEEDRDEDLLQEFFRDPRHNAFWFQIYKLEKRQGLCRVLDLEERPHEVHLLDRTLPGDMAFALWNYAVGNFTAAQFRIYMKQLTKVSYRSPFLVIYFTASPARLVERVATRGHPDEIAFYTEDYYRLMDICYRTALDMSGCAYCVVDWSADHEGVALHHSVPTEARRLVDADACMDLLNTAISATYGPNLERIRDAARRNEAPFVAAGQPMFGRDPAELSDETRDLLLSRSGELSRKLAESM